MADCEAALEFDNSKLLEQIAYFISVTYEEICKMNV